MSGALAGGVNEAAVSKLMKTLGPNNPDLVQIASAALGYATNKMAGEDALAGAALAQWGTKWNDSEENSIAENAVSNSVLSAYETKTFKYLGEVKEIDGKTMYKFLDKPGIVVYSGTLVKTKIDKFLNVSGSRHCSIEQQCREVALCWRDVPDG